MKKLLLTSFLLLSVLLSGAVSTFAQGKGNLRGFLTDEENGEALAYGNVFIKELKTGASTDINGYYYITSLPEGNYTVIYSYMGYEPKSLKAVIKAGNTTQINMTLSAAQVELGVVEKVAKKEVEKNVVDVGLQRINVRQLEMLPKGVETDVMRSLQFLPGVRSTGDVSARYYVRGGASNENLVLLNGVTIYNPFHAMGLFSVIDPEMINNVEFYKGGFSAEYGDRMSSVLSITSKDGNKNQYGVKASSSYLTGKFLAEGPIPDGSFILAGRKSYNNDILRKFFNDQNAPFDFYDAFFKVNYNGFVKDAKFEVFGFLSDDKMDEGDPMKEEFVWNNDLVGLKWLQVYDSPLMTEFLFSTSSFSGEVLPNFSTTRPKKNEVNDVSLDFDFTYLFDSKDEVDVGLKIKSIKTSLYLENQSGTLSEITDNSTRIAAYAKYNLLRFPNFGLDAGTRLNLIGLTKAGTFTFEPRVSFNYWIFPFLSLKGAWGVYNQELTTLANENEVISLFEPWIIVPSYIDPPKSYHYIAGIKLDLGKFSGSIETYYKEIKNLPALNENKKLADDPDLISGNGEAYGAEFLFNYRNKTISATASYTLSYAYRDIDEWLYYPKFDSRHTLNLSFDYNFGKGWSAGAVWSYNTGLPFTPMIGFYDKLALGDFYANPFIWENYSPYTILGDKNIGRLPDYHRLDLSLSKKFDFDFVAVYLDFSILNVYNRKNIFYFKRDTAERVNMLPFLPTATLKVEI